MSNSNVSGPSSGNLDRLEIEVRLADRRKLLLLVHLRQAVHQQLALDLLGDVLAKAGLDQLPRRPARPKARHVRRRHQLAELLVEVAVDVLAGDRHRDVPLAGAAVVDLDFQRQAARLPLRLPPRRLRRSSAAASGSLSLSVSAMIVPGCEMSSNARAVEEVVGWGGSCTAASHLPRCHGAAVQLPPQQVAR